MTTIPRPPGAILETVLYVDDLAAATRFYGEVLGLRHHSSKDGVFAFFMLERQMLLLFDPTVARAKSDLPSHGTKGVTHVCFTVAEDQLTIWQAHLAAAAVPVELLHTWPEGGWSLYFRDPAGNSLEVAPAVIWDFAEVT